MLQLLLYFISAKVESIEDITFLFSKLWDIIKLLNCEHRAKVIVHCVGHVIGGGDNNSIQRFEEPYVVPYNSSHVGIRVEDSGIVFFKLLLLSLLLLLQKIGNASPGEGD